MIVDTPHNEPNNVNTVIRDVDSDITGYGTHNRLLVFQDYSAGEITLREDILHDLPMSNADQRRKVLNGWQRMHPAHKKLTYVSSSERYSSANKAWESIDHTYKY